MPYIDSNIRVFKGKLKIILNFQDLPTDIEDKFRDMALRIIGRREKKYTRFFEEIVEYALSHEEELKKFIELRHTMKYYIEQ